MKNWKTWLALGGLLLAIAALALVSRFTREAPVEGEKKITVTVVHKDQSEKRFVCRTQEDYLGPVLLAEQIVQGEMGQFGLFILSADGEVADWSVDQGWWAVYEGDTLAPVGADELVIEDGDSFRLVYSCG